MVYANSSSWLGIGIETTVGVAAALPTYWVPVKSPKITPMITEVTDEALRGSMVKVYNQIPTVRHDEYSFSCLAYPDTMPLLFRSLLGSPDTITGTGPYTHTLSLLNNAPLTANQPPSYTFFDYDGYQVRQLTAGQVDDLSIKFTATGLIELTVKVLTNPFTIRTGAVPATAFSTVQAVPAWNVISTINSVALTTVVDGEIDLKRGTKPVHTLGTQAPYKFQVGPLDISAKATVINTNDAEINYYLNDTILPINFAFTPPAATTSAFSFDMNTCKIKAASHDRGSDELIVTSLDIQPLPNTVDATAGGVSPIKGIFTTAQSTTY